MKHGKRPTVRQCKEIQKAGFDPAEYLVVKDTTAELVIVARNSDDAITTIIHIHKEKER